MLLETKQTSSIKQKDVAFSKEILVSLKEVLRYLSSLKAKGEISDQTYEALVKFILASFIENLVEQKIGTVIENKLGRKFEQVFLNTKL